MSLSKKKYIVNHPMFGLGVAVLAQARSQAPEEIFSINIFQWMRIQHLPICCENWTGSSDDITNSPLKIKQNQEMSRIRSWWFWFTHRLYWTVLKCLELLVHVVLLSQKLVFNRWVYGQNLALKVSFSNASWRSKAQVWREGEGTWLPMWHVATHGRHMMWYCCDIVVIWRGGPSHPVIGPHFFCPRYPMATWGSPKVASQGWLSMTFKWTFSQAQARCRSSRKSLRRRMDAVYNCCLLIVCICILYTASMLYTAISAALIQEMLSWEYAFLSARHLFKARSTAKLPFFLQLRDSISHSLTASQHRCGQALLFGLEKSSDVKQPRVEMTRRARRAQSCLLSLTH